MKAVRYLLLIVVFAVLVLAVFNMRPFGEPTSYEMEQYIINNSQEETGSNNVVSAVVFDYRGLDTLGEASILFTAASGVYLIFRRSKNG